ncbi:L,D-transpeptidase [Tessaracoccus sp. MC1865]|nr:L,D-transpeptidase [Tessaracoccus sp. MC1865]MBB1508397.1 L,D-transpeptidase [Tessaracoccus sp. MC1756]
MTGRAFCVSKGQDKMAWVINGKVQTIVDVRFGRTATPTRNGAFKIGWKSRDHFSSIYKVDMPFALFFDGGIAIHYSANFARVGYSGGSGGCVNVRDYAQMERFFDIARVGDKVIVYN